MLQIDTILHDREAGSRCLRAWRRRADRKPLVLRGARQVGKTTSVDLFGAEFRQYVALNLDHPGDREIFDQGLPLGRTLEAIFFLKNADPAEASTLLFLDEIQSSPHAVQLLRYFAEERADLAVVAAGSLLEVALDRYRASFPVGRVEFLYHYPLTFAELRRRRARRLAGRDGRGPLRGLRRRTPAASVSRLRHDRRHARDRGVVSRASGPRPPDATVRGAAGLVRGRRREVRPRPCAARSSPARHRDGSIAGR